MLDIFQAISFVICLITIPLWLAIGHRFPAARGWSLVIIIPQFATIIFYALVFITDWNETNAQVAQLFSASLRAYVQAIMLFLGIAVMRYLGQHE